MFTSMWFDSLHGVFGRWRIRNCSENVFCDVVFEKRFKTFWIVEVIHITCMRRRQVHRVGTADSCVFWLKDIYWQALELPRRRERQKVHVGKIIRVAPMAHTTSHTCSHNIFHESLTHARSAHFHHLQLSLHAERAPLIALHGPKPNPYCSTIFKRLKKKTAAEHNL